MKATGFTAKVGGEIFKYNYVCHNDKDSIIKGICRITNRLHSFKYKNVKLIFN